MSKEVYCKHKDGSVEYLGGPSEYNKEYCEFSEGEYFVKESLGILKE